MDQITRIFIDTSKSVFQLHGMNAAEAVVVGQAEHVLVHVAAGGRPLDGVGGPRDIPL